MNYCMKDLEGEACKHVAVSTFSLLLFCHHPSSEVRVIASALKAPVASPSWCPLEKEP